MNFYFIINTKEYVLIEAESEEIAVEVFNRFSMCKKYAYICNSITENTGKMLEFIKQRKTS